MSFCPACQTDFPDDYARCPHDGTTLLTGRTVGKYKITARIGVGGMGAVYRAVNPDTRAEVAVKLLHAKAAANSSIRLRFQREAEAVAALRTRHVVRIFDFGNDEETLYLVMELLDGDNLREILKKGAMATDRAFEILDGALRGLAAAHRAGVTHRDLKPENLFLANTDDGEVVKVLDFGIARVADAKLTDTGALIGTPAYMAPEQIASSFGEVGPRTDCFSMGVIAYEILTGISPFLAGAETSSVNEILGRVVEDKREPLQKHRPDLPPEVIAFVERALSDFEDRFANADEMRTALGTLAGVSGGARIAPESGAQSGATVASHGTDLAGQQLPPQTGAPAPRSKGLWFAAVAAILAIGGISAFLALREDDSSKKLATTEPPKKLAQLEAAPTEAQANDEPAPPPGMVRIEGGTYPVGADYPKFKSALKPGKETVEGFWIDAYESSKDGKMPLSGMTHAAATAHCASLGKRLPTESEWEIAARRGTLSNGRFLEKGNVGPALVATHPNDKTTDGAFDLLGNVAEWTSSEWVGKDGGKSWAVRGASFSVRAKSGFYSTIHARFLADADYQDKEVGFRCALDDPQPPATPRSGQ